MNKSEFLNGLREEYQQWEALLNQIGEERMDQSGVAADWSIKDIVAHLTGWRRRTVARLQAAQRGEPDSGRGGFCAGFSVADGRRLDGSGKRKLD